LQALYLCSRSE